MKFLNRIALLFVLFLPLLGCREPDPVPPSIPSPLPTNSSIPATAGRVWGLTLDSVDNLPAIVDAIKSLPKKPWVRIVFDYPEPASNYVAAVKAIAPYAEIVGQPSDSTYSAKMSVAAYKARLQEYVTQLKEITIWEIANEENGDWVGAGISPKIDAAYDVVKSAGKLTQITPYWDTPNCQGKNGPFVAWHQNNISAKVKAGVDYVLVSIYGEDCEGPEPTQSDVQKFTDQLGVIFPGAKLGIGEYGSKTEAKNPTLIRYYQTMSINHPRYIFAGLWWYGASFGVPKTKASWAALAEGMK